MSVRSETNPSEQLLAPDGVLAENVFSSVYESFVAEAGNTALASEPSLANTQRQRTTTELDHEFTEARFSEAARTIGPLAERSVRPSDIREKLINEALAEAKEHDNPLHAGVRVEGATRVVAGFIQRASEMFVNKETDGLTVRLFFDRLQDLGGGLKVGYDHLVAKHDEPEPGQEAQQAYSQAIHTMLDVRPDVVDQKDGGFLHVNQQHFLESKETIDERYFISPKLNGQPEEVIKAWIETLDSLELADTLYYKVTEDLSRGYDSLIAYVTPTTKDDMERAIKEFALRCSPELLSDTVIPTGFEVAKGIARAPEPYQLNALLSYCGKRKVSYNQFACALTELALQRASFDFIQQGIHSDQVTSDVLATAATPYFTQFVKLSGLDPVTMKSGQWWT